MISLIKERLFGYPSIHCPIPPYTRIMPVTPPTERRHSWRDKWGTLGYEKFVQLCIHGERERERDVLEQLGEGWQGGASQECSGASLLHRSPWGVGGQGGSWDPCWIWRRQRGLHHLTKVGHWFRSRLGRRCENILINSSDKERQLANLFPNSRRRLRDALSIRLEKITWQIPISDSNAYLFVICDCPVISLDIHTTISYSTST